MGHVWMSAQFASGRAFGINNFHPLPDGSVRFHEGWLLDEGEILPAKSVQAPWKPRWLSKNPTARPPTGRAVFPATQQAIVLFHWEFEDTSAMIERSSALEQKPTPPLT
jgi:hypothetical protein